MNRLLTLSFLISFILIGIAAPAHAQQVDKQAQINELLDLMEMDNMVDALYTQMQTMLERNRSQLSIADSPDELAIWQEYESKTTDLFKSVMSWEKMKPEFVKVYDYHFNKEEIQDLLVFYRTPTGKKLIEKMPIINQQSMLAGQELAQQIRPIVLSLSQELATKLQALRQEKLAEQ